MKFYNLLRILALLFFVFSCTNEETIESQDNSPVIQDKYFTAVVLTTADANCKLPVVNFIGDTSGIHSIFYDQDTSKVEYDFSRSAFGPFIVIDFPDSLKIKDQKIKIKFRKPYKDKNEIPFCLTFGPNYLAIVMLSEYKTD